MKTIFTFILSAFLLTGFSLKAQVVFIFSAPEGEEILKIDEDKHEKTVTFMVSGLNTIEEVNALVDKFKATKGVHTFTISEDIKDGKREAFGLFEGCVSFDFFKKLLLDTGVLDLVINGEPLKSEELHKVWKSKQNESPTHPGYDGK